MTKPVPRVKKMRGVTPGCPGTWVGGYPPSGKKKRGGVGDTPLPPHVRKWLRFCMGRTGVSCGGVGNVGRVVDTGEKAQRGCRPSASVGLDPPEESCIIIDILLEIFSEVREKNKCSTVSIKLTSRPDRSTALQHSSRSLSL